MSTILDKIFETKKADVEQLKNSVPIGELKKMVQDSSPCRDFKSALTSRECAVIAEVKFRSPSKGQLRTGLDPVSVAECYERNGAAAISVLTDRDFFGGDKLYLNIIRRAVGLSLLRKDFILDPWQIYESRMLGADAVLLIVGMLDDIQLQEFLELAGELGLAALVEVHDLEELERALKANAGIIGINNRNLKNFVTDLNTSLELISSIPGDRVVVTESGIRSRDDIRRLMTAGISAFLIGETLMAAPDIGRKLRELLGNAKAAS
jgi:indole-3-glycerol phosphate synthase